MKKKLLVGIPANIGMSLFFMGLMIHLSASMHLDSSSSFYFTLFVVGVTSFAVAIHIRQAFKMFLSVLLKEDASS